MTMRIYCRPNGPYVLEGVEAGDVEIVDRAGNRFTPDPSKPKIALCRCGASSTRPFCDGSHHHIAFQADDQAPAAEGT